MTTMIKARLGKEKRMTSANVCRGLVGFAGRLAPDTAAAMLMFSMAVDVLSWDDILVRCAGSFTRTKSKPSCRVSQAVVETRERGKS